MPPANAPVEAMRPPSRVIHSDLSDLFFNYEHDDARRLDRGEFVGWDSDKLNEHAATVLGNLAALGVEGLPAPETLVEDFLDRC
jgi:hypothetical protein